MPFNPRSKIIPKNPSHCNRLSYNRFNMVYVRLFLSNKRLLTFGIMLTFFAGFGKTFLISLYIPELLKEFDLGLTTFSGLYALATIAGGIFIIYLGRLIDDIKLRKYAIWVT